MQHILPDSAKHGAGNPRGQDLGPWVAFFDGLWVVFNKGSNAFQKTTLLLRPTSILRNRESLSQRFLQDIMPLAVACVIAWDFGFNNSATL